MGLQIWLPLMDNTLNNQGINPMSFSYINNNSKLVYNSSGRLGITDIGCWERTTINTNDAIVSSTTINLDNDFSMACWAFVTTAGAQTSANGLITNHNHNTNSGAGITVKYISETDARISCNTGNGSSRTYHTYYGTTNIYNAWHHLCLTFKKSTNTMSLWVDGIMEKSFTYAQVGGDNLFNIFDWSTGYTHNASYRPLAKINDVRAYDHCLSTKEIREIMKDLILHYKLDGSNLEGSNLLKNTSNPIDTTGLAHTTVQIVEFDEQKQQNVFVKSTTATSKSYIYSSRTAQVEQSTAYTFSCDMWANDYVRSTEFFWLSDTEANQKTGTGYVNVTNLGITIEKRNEWFHVEKTFTTKADDYTGYVRIDNNGSSTSETAAILKITNLKLEKGSVATPYTMNASEIYGNEKEFDYSLYKNHGTTSLTTSANTSAIYSNAARFPASTSQYIQNSYLRLMPNMTFSVWVNFNALTAGFIIDARKSENGVQPMYFNPSSGIQIFSNVGGTDASTGAYISFSPTVNTWYHLVCAFDEDGSKLYINGELQGSTGAKIATGTDSVLTLGVRHTVTTPADMSLNDLRVYATTLSADEIKELYQTKASIADTGAMLAYDFDETNIETNLSITKTGIVKASDISELPGATDMKITVLDDGSAWGRIFYHKNNAGTTLFSAVDECRNIQETDRYSRLYLLDEMCGNDGKYEFMLTYPNEFAGQYNRWKQTNNPCDEYIAQTSDGSGVATGYEAVHIDWNTNYWGGLTRQNSDATTNSSCYLSGSVGHSNWFFAIGAKTAWNDAIPGPASAAVSVVELWVRLDTLNNLAKASFLNNKFLQSNYIYEF